MAYRTEKRLRILSLNFTGHFPLAKDISLRPTDLCPAVRFADQNPKSSVSRLLIDALKCNSFFESAQKNSISQIRRRNSIKDRVILPFYLAQEARQIKFEDNDYIYFVDYTQIESPGDHVKIFQKRKNPTAKDPYYAVYLSVKDPTGGKKDSGEIKYALYKTKDDFEKNKAMFKKRNTRSCFQVALKLMEHLDEPDSEK